MPCFGEKIPVALALAVAFSSSAPAQTPAPPLSQTEPGLERVINWSWRAEPSPATTWGLRLPVFAPSPSDPTRAPADPATPPRPGQIPGRPDSYEVRRGDALILIGKRFSVSVARLKEANGLTTDQIRIGQILQIPLPDTPKAPSPRPTTPGSAAPAAPDAREMEVLTLQVHLDRAQFSAGPIDGTASAALHEISELYRGAHPDLPDAAALQEKARAAVPAPLTRYTLRAEDFRFIAPPKAVAAPSPTAATGKKKKPAAPAEIAPPPPTLEELLAGPLLAYRSPWEFVAERFHCRESYLRKLNPHLKGVPAVGAEFRVPNVVPFAIEALPTTALQPAAGAEPAVTAAIVNASRLEISRGGTLIASLPVAIARPGLRGKGEWTVLDAISRPRLVIRHEPRGPAAPTRIYGTETPSTVAPTPTPAPIERILPPGPRNPAGVVWIHLAKAGESTPLPYGLHGTSRPDDMATQRSLGGLRLANWDAVRAARLLPPGTTLEWREPGVAPAAPPRPAP